MRPESVSESLRAKSAPAARGGGRAAEADLSVAEADRAALEIRAALDRLSAVLARAAAAFVRVRAWHVFGFARLDDHARERFGRSGRWLRDLAALGDGLAASPLLGSALAGSDGGSPLGRVAATLIARAASPFQRVAEAPHSADPPGHFDIEHWIQVARHLSVRDLRAALRLARGAPDPAPNAASDPDSDNASGPSPDSDDASGPGPDATTTADDDPDADRVLFRCPVSLPILAAFDEALDLHRSVEGRSATVTEFVEALVAEARSSGLPDEASGLVSALERGTPDAQVEAALRRSSDAWAGLPPPLAADGSADDAGTRASSEVTSGEKGLGELFGSKHHTLSSSPASSNLDQMRELEAAAGRGDAATLDRQIRALVAMENELEARLGEALALLAERGDWMRLHFAGIGHYAEERLGMSRSRAGERARLARSLRGLPSVAAACAAGRITMEAAALLHRILGDETGAGTARPRWDAAAAASSRARIAGSGPADRAALEAAWVEHASSVTIKRMRDEARAMGRYKLRPHDARPATRPLSDASWHVSIRREAGTSTRRIQSLGRLAADAGRRAAGDGRREPDVFHSRLHEPDVCLRLRLPADLAADLLATIAAARDAVEARVASIPWDADWPPAAQRPPVPSEWAARIAFVRARRAPLWVGLLALLEDFVATWDTSEGSPDRRDDRIFVRDGWRCAAPGCSSRRHLEDHHVLYRSRGGDDGEANRVTLCRFHHQRGEHGGLMQVRGAAPLGLTWRLGRDDVAVTYRNERRAPSP